MVNTSSKNKKNNNKTQFFEPFFLLIYDMQNSNLYAVTPKIDNKIAQKCNFVFVLCNVDVYEYITKKSLTLYETSIIIIYYIKKSIFLIF